MRSRRNPRIRDGEYMVGLVVGGDIPVQFVGGELIEEFARHMIALGV